MPVCRHNCEFDASIKREQHPPVAAMLQRLDSNNPAVDTVHTYGVLATNYVQLGLRCLPIYRFDAYHHPGRGCQSASFTKLHGTPSCRVANDSAAGSGTVAPFATVQVRCAQRNSIKIDHLLGELSAQSVAACAAAERVVPCRNPSISLSQNVRTNCTSHCHSHPLP